MKKIVFTKVRSRLGLLNPAWKEKENKFGVEEGPDEVLSKEFLDSFVNHEVIEYNFVSPKEIKDTEHYKKTLLNDYRQLDKAVSAKVSKNCISVFVGGDHSIAFGNLLQTVTNHNVETTGYINFDTHPDLNSFETSITDNFHGIWLRPFFEKSGYEEVDNIVKYKIEPNNAVFIGNLDAEEAELNFLRQNKIKIFQVDKLKEAKAELKEMVEKLDHIHISFDMDIFNSKIVDATTCPSPRGLFEKDVMPLLKVLSYSDSLSIDLVEVIPNKDKDGKVVKLAQKILNTLLQNV